jgi:hypothetical protein
MIRPITIHLKTERFALLKLSIIWTVAMNGKAKVQVHESKLLKGFVFKITRNKTIIVKEL